MANEVAKPRGAEGLTAKYPWAVAALALGAACGPPPESQTGSLGYGSFVYDCVSNDDPNCPTAGNLSEPFPAAIALGGRFSLTYSPTDSSRFPTPIVDAVSRDFFVSQGHVFAAVRAGRPSFYATTQDGQGLDFTAVNVEPIVSIQIRDTSTVIPNVTGGVHTYTASALGALSQTLAGEVLYVWSSSNADVLTVQTPSGLPSPSSSVNVLFKSKGTATLTATNGVALGSVSVTVEGP